MRRYLGLMLVMLVSFSTYAEGEPPPYLYYYSNTLNAFVVERADGTDSRILAHEIVGADVQSVNMVGWSPSGDWLAWVEDQSILKVIAADGNNYHIISNDSRYL